MSDLSKLIQCGVVKCPVKIIYRAWCTGFNLIKLGIVLQS
jgi:hypothetical protein